MQRRRALTALAALTGSGLALLGLSGCGFRLRGSVSTPDTRGTAGAANGPLTFRLLGKVGTTTSALAVHLGRMGHTVRRGVQDTGHDYTIWVDADEMTQTVVNTGVSGRVNEVLIALRFVWALSDSSGREVLGQRAVTAEQSMSYDESVALAKAEESAAIEGALLQQAVDDLVSQLPTSATKRVGTPTAAP